MRWMRCERGTNEPYARAYLQLPVRTEVWIGVIQPHHKPERDQTFVHVVYPAAAIRMEVERPAHGMDDLAWFMLAGVDAPYLLEPESISLRVASVTKLEASDGLLR